MKCTLLFLVTITLLYESSQNDENGYYWRDYFGTIPSDAYIAGTDFSGNKVYIGQGYYRNHGLKPGRITPGVKEMPVPWGHENKISTSNKILCGPQENFYWVKTNATHLKCNKVDYNQTVLGGHDDDQGVLYIGKINNDGNIKIGKVMSCWPWTAYMYYIDGSYEKQIDEYEVLMYEEPSIDARLNEYDVVKTA